MPRSTTLKYADTFPLDMSKSTRDGSIYSSVYADRPEVCLGRTITLAGY